MLPLGLKSIASDVFAALLTLDGTRFAPNAESKSDSRGGGARTMANLRRLFGGGVLEDESGSSSSIGK